jgi:hypothetical protein
MLPQGCGIIHTFQNFLPIGAKMDKQKAIELYEKEKEVVKGMSQAEKQATFILVFVAVVATLIAAVAIAVIV